MKSLYSFLFLMCGASTAWAAGACCGFPPARDEDAPAKVEPKPQATCPVKGGAVSKDHFVDVKGVRVFVCCKECVEKVKSEPGKYIDKVKANGEALTPSPACEKCKNPVGSDKCCK